MSTRPFFSWYVSESTLPKNLEKHLQEAGLAMKATFLGMSLELKGEMKTPSSPLQFKRVSRGAPAQDFARLLIASDLLGPIGENFFNELPALLFAENYPWEIWIAYLDHEPIAAATLMLHGQIAGIWALTVAAAHRGRGYGRAMMEHLLNRSHSKGYHMAGLIAPKENTKLYQSLGFTPFTDYRKWGKS